MTLLHQAAQKAVEAKEREAFEHWYSEAGRWPKSVARGEDGHYLLAQANSSYEAWRAAVAALQQQPEPVALSEGRILHLWDTHVGYETGAKRPLDSGDKMAFARAVLYAAQDALLQPADTHSPALQHQEVPREPVAWVPIHPRNGPLWSMATDNPSPERMPNSYPLRPLVFADASPSTTRQQEVGSESTRAVQLTVEEIAFVMNELTPEHDGSDFEADCPSCTAYAKLKAAVDWDAEHGIAAAPSTPENADGVDACGEALQKGGA